MPVFVIGGALFVNRSAAFSQADKSHKTDYKKTRQKLVTIKNWRVSGLYSVPPNPNTVGVGRKRINSHQERYG
jgi:hypothetical protein